MSAAEVLRKARRRIEVDGRHSRNGMYGPDGCVCIIVAVGHACRDFDSGVRDEQARQAAIGALYTVMGVDKDKATGEMVAWNDSHDTPEVLAAFDHAIAIAEAA